MCSSLNSNWFDLILRVFTYVALEAFNTPLNLAIHLGYGTTQPNPAGQTHRGWESNHQ